MAKENTLTERLGALMAKFKPAAVEEIVEEVVTDPAAPVEEVVEEVVTPERDLAADIDALMKIVEELGAMIAQMQATPSVEAQLKTYLDGVRSDEIMPQASVADIKPEEQPAPVMGVLEARQKEIQSKFKK